MSAIEEVVRVLRSSGVMLSAGEIIKRGDFTVDTGSLMAILQQNSQPGKPLERERVDGIYRYRVREGADLSDIVAPKNGKHAIAEVSKAHAVSLSSSKNVAEKKDTPAKQATDLQTQTFPYDTATDAAKRIVAMMSMVKRDGFVWLRNDGRIKLAGEAYKGGEGEILVGKYCPDAHVDDIADDIEDARDTLTADKRAKLTDSAPPKPADAKPVPAPEIPAFVPPAPKADKPEDKPAPAPAAQPSDKSGQLPDDLTAKIVALDSRVRWLEARREAFDADTFFRYLDTLLRLLACYTSHGQPWKDETKDLCDRIERLLDIA